MKYGIYQMCEINDYMCMKGNVWMKLILGLVLAQIGWIDYRTKRIPNVMLGVFIIAVFLKKWLGMESIENAQILGIFAVSVPVFGIAMMFPGSFGGGDIKLLAAGGFLLGWKGTFYAFGIGMYIAAIYSVIKLLRKELHCKTEIALGPALCAGIFLMLCWGEKIETFLR